MKSDPPGSRPDPDRMLTPQEALAAILRHAEPLGGEQVELSRSLGRVLRQSVRSGRVLPPWDNSAMDGYAVRAAEVAAGLPLPVRGVIAAGHPATVELAPGSTMRIMTGAPLPKGADAVIMREEAQEQGGEVRFTATASVGQHIRYAGEDIALGEEILRAGALLGPGEVGLLAALGRTLVEVYRQPRVAIVSTGDELVPADMQPGPGQIVNSNSHALSAQILEAGGVPIVLPIVRDDRALLRQTFVEALRADVMVSSGGVSVGEFDYVREVLAELGFVEEFARVAMKPGKPLTFSRAPSGNLCFGLPGNPASSMVSFELFVRPALRRLQGHGLAAVGRPLVPVQLATSVVPDRTRPHFARARVSRSPEPGAPLLAHVPEKQGSGMLRSMVGINALLHVPPGAASLPVGATLPATLLTVV